MAESRLKEETLEKIESREFTVAVVGMGYVGLPIAVEFAKAGFPVVGIDLSQEKVEQLNQGRSYVGDVSDKLLAPFVKSGRLKGTTDYSAVRDVDGVVICVPTPLSKTRDPDVSYIMDASTRVAGHLKRGHVISLESTTYPGTTKELILPIFQAGELVADRDFFLAFSPERISPGDTEYGVANTPKVVGGVGQDSTEVVAALYRHVIEKVVPVSSAEAAEMSKLLENTFRAVNIALVNELAIMCEILGIEVWEVISAASTKPFGYMPFYPGPGIGGHCIPIDPYYLSWKMKTLNYNARMIEVASEINTSMPRYVVNLVAGALNEERKSIRGAKVLVLGAAYKPDIDDVRESPSLDVMELLEERGAEVSYNDPYVSTIELNGAIRQCVELSTERIKSADCVLILTPHSSYDYGPVRENARLVVDTKDALKGDAGSARLVKL